MNSLSTPRKFTLEDIVGLHELVMQATGSLPQPIRLGGEGLLISAINRPQNAAYYEGASIKRQAALLCIAISQAQAFLDGNKRTAVIATDVFFKSVSLRLAPGSISLANKLEQLAESLTQDHSQSNLSKLEDDLESWFELFVVSNSNPDPE